ncbi:MAG TPA: sigma-70 family RNA polymerase sigma factor [Devosia sp.]|nr:sigma-70 family RNA polymerase sigma factor [Devosia sp.]
MNLRLDADGKTRVVAERAKLDSDQAATLFRNTVLPHLADGLALARWLAGDATDAEDIVQEAAMKALRGIDTFEGNNARAWLLAIVRNTTFSWLAKHRPKALVMVGGLAEIDETTYSADAGSGPIPDTPEAALIRRADTALVEAAIAQLPLPFREIVVFRDINELSYRDIAAMLNVPIGTVMSRLSRARARLASIIAEKDS